MERTVDISLVPRDGLATDIADLLVVSGDLEHETSLRSAVVLSLFTDRRATTEELEDYGGRDARGWWGDYLATVDGDSFGSKLWLLNRKKQVNETLLQARQYAQRALAWMVEDQIAREVEVEATWQGMGRLCLDIVIHRADDVSERFAFVWEL